MRVLYLWEKVFVDFNRNATINPLSLVVKAITAQCTNGLCMYCYILCMYCKASNMLRLLIGTPKGLVPLVNAIR